MFKKSMLKKISLMLVLLAFTSLALAESAAEKLQGYLKQMQTLEGSFEQLTVDGRGQRMQEAQGTLLLAKPGRFYWSTEQPFPQVLISNGATLWVYDPDLEQVTIQTLDKQATQSPAIILAGEAKDLTQHFAIDFSVTGKRVVFNLIPLEADSLFEELSLHFVDERINALQLKDSLGQKTRVDLSISKFNQPIDKQLFEFEVPANVDVIQE
ncbi:outer membrane lipoprotein chaperone LolA [Marinospirillum insulare]|uniref:Outer-membrane lipoprotein carrier protein n=1 Tax=Marinospirillum insulare TaxID=217169 RepID=A0ABQ5ZSK8_9GAMM|nr:outer membrane lipoprotein chaperone LolA [Marinospirillum insulare]GLR63115.1 outer-membrane lipoprotein carrier protein [Marinospirillum insulare]